MTFYFTYGSAHQDAQGNSLGNCFTPIAAKTYASARELMMEARGPKWAFQYDLPEQAGVKKWMLTERSLDSVRILPAKATV